jgi:hypothetical protein
MATAATSARQPSLESAARGRTDTTSSQLSLRTRREPQAHGLGRLVMATQGRELVDCLIEEPLQLLKLGEPTGDIGLDPSVPAMPQPELEATKLEGVGSQLTQGHTDSTAARVAVVEQRAGDEIVGVHG